MSVESTRRTMEAYVQALVSFGDYTDYMADEVTFTFMETGRVVRGREAARHLIDSIHRRAFRTEIRVRQVLYGEESAIAEAEFVATYSGEFGEATADREVRVFYATAYDLEGGKIKAARLYFPVEALIRQVGGPTQ